MIPRLTDSLEDQFFIMCRMCEVDKDIILTDGGLWWMHLNTRTNWQTKGQAMFHAAIVKMESDPYYVGLLEKCTLDYATTIYDQEDIDWFMSEGASNTGLQLNQQSLLGRLIYLVKNTTKEW